MTGSEVKITVDPRSPIIGIAALDASTQGGRAVDEQAPWIYLLAPAPPEYGADVMGVVKCDRCRMTTTLPTGMNMGLFATVSDAFMATHRQCPEGRA